MAPDPGRTALYRLFGSRGDLLYVGITSDPEARFAQHGATKRWWSAVRTHSVEWYESRLSAMAAEEAVIKLHEPPFNTEHCRFPAEFTVTAEFGRLQYPGIDILRARVGAADRAEVVQWLVVRELAARGLLGEGPCFHDIWGWPEGIEFRNQAYENGICSCGSPVTGQQAGRAHREDADVPPGADTGDAG